jgi:hypothetical protein
LRTRVARHHPASSADATQGAVTRHSNNMLEYDAMKLLAIIGLGVCVYYLIDVASKWQQRNEVQKVIWFAFIAICAGLCFFVFLMN